ncbi:uncharacterized protein LOC118646779 [Monomorium pharaonis]|uniref:uncharacterized protein LOC118646779 n=1 Tax=Monomorium pharaonis TaxID=307658 RepID=UPI001747069E|nr:uncharacterized protein LOC118646779 [Monomorium pharaonis]
MPKGLKEVRKRFRSLEARLERWQTGEEDLDPDEEEKRGRKVWRSGQGERRGSRGEEKTVGDKRRRGGKGTKKVGVERERSGGTMETGGGKEAETRRTGRDGKEEGGSDR